MSKNLVSTKISRFTVYLLPFAFLLLLCQFVSAQPPQDEEPPPDAAPPPIKLLSKDERKMLEGENDAKKRVKVSFGLMDARLLKAEKLNTDESFKESLNELAGFQAILDNTLNYLIQKNNSGNKNDKRFMDFEIYLRKQIPRLEVIRREMPVKYGYHVGKIMKVVRDARAKAVEPLFSDSVVPVKKTNDN